MTSSIRFFILLAASLILFSSCAGLNSREGAPLTRIPTAYDVSSPQTSSADLSFQELNQILKEKRFSKIEELLSYLSKIKPQYMSHYTLGYESRSLHASSKTHPRAIVFGEKANFVITFNGHRRQEAYDKLEVVEFNQNNKRFEFREIQFNDLGALPKGTPYTISQIGGPEGKCLQCHTNSRPIWEAYPVWPGFYGADDDAPIGFSGRGPSLKMGFSEDKLKSQWETFLRDGMKQPRYRHLKPMAESDIFGSTYGKRPNSDLAFLLTKNNTERIVRLIHEKTDPSFRFAYLYASRCYQRIIGQNFSIKQNNKISGTQAPLIPISRAFEHLANEYQSKYNAISLNHQVYRAQRLITDLQYNEKEFRQFWEKYWSDKEPALPRQGPILEFLNVIIANSDPYTMPHKVAPMYTVIAGLTEKFFPEAEPNTWPSALYEGVHQYDTGSGNEVSWLQKTILENLFTQTEQEQLLSQEQQDWRSFCSNLEAQLPSALDQQ